jgi:hypothetical protein
MIDHDGYTQDRIRDDSPKQWQLAAALLRNMWDFRWAEFAKDVVKSGTRGGSDEMLHRAMMEDSR